MAALPWDHLDVVPDSWFQLRHRNDWVNPPMWQKLQVEHVLPNTFNNFKGTNLLGVQLPVILSWDLVSLV